MYLFEEVYNIVLWAYCFLGGCIYMIYNCDNCRILTGLHDVNFRWIRHSLNIIVIASLNATWLYIFIYSYFLFERNISDIVCFPWFCILGLSQYLLLLRHGTHDCGAAYLFALWCSFTLGTFSNIGDAQIFGQITLWSKQGTLPIWETQPSAIAHWWNQIQKQPRPCFLYG